MLKKFLATLVKTATTIGTSKLNQLKEKSVLLVKLAQIFIYAGRDVITALLDGDKDNAAQLKKILTVHTNSIIMEGAELAREKVREFKDETLSAAVLVYLNGAEELLMSLVDENPDNEAQALAILNEYKDKIIKPTVDLATDKLALIIQEKVKDPLLAAVLIELLQSLDELIKTKEPVEPFHFGGVTKDIAVNMEGMAKI